MRAVDLGCGTGEDALRMQRAGLTVDAIDVSPQMVARARAKGVYAQVLDIEESGSLDTDYDIALSNFGALNCVADLTVAGKALRRLVRPGGRAVLCLPNRFCLWELLHFTLTGDWRKSVRRLRGADEASNGVYVRYYSASQVRTTLDKGFELEADCGVGIFTPPSFVSVLGQRSMALASRLDRRMATTFFGRNIEDHRLLVFRRVA
jgi:SAM-dependent methyltransferase